MTGLSLDKALISFHPLIVVNNKMNQLLHIALIVIPFMIPTGAKVKAGMSIWQVADRIDIETVPSGFPVGFSILTHGQRQYAAYYDEKHQMTVATRQLGQRKWDSVKLDSKIEWDSHNYITMEIDKNGDLHLAGNMHCVPLIYFRTETPGDIRTLKRLSMTGKEENKCTYPHFIHDATGRLVFNYRNGKSGNGQRLYNVYHPKSRTWSRLLKTPLFDGEGKRNAYPNGPKIGPDKRFHVLWVWRDTFDCATNNNLSYARSPDLIHWETASGQAVELPMTLANKNLIVDPIPSGGGIINGGARLFFDSQNRPMVVYHKSDVQNYMQIYVARFENGLWVKKQLTDWNKPVLFSGGGSMGFIGIRVYTPKKVRKDVWVVGYRHRDYGSGRIAFSETSLRLVTDQPKLGTRELPSEIYRPEIKFQGITVRRAIDIGNSGDPDIRYILKWDVLPPNYDRKRTGLLPPPSMLRMYKLVRNASQN